MWVLVVPDEYWVSESDTRRRIGGGQLRFANAVHYRRLVEVDTAALKPGFLKASVECEEQWWARTPRWRRSLRAFFENL